MKPPEHPEEPLKNIDLESAILGTRMALTPEEEIEARQALLEQIARSTLAVPTVQPVPTMPDGSIVPNTNITFVVMETPEDGSGIPGFTTLGDLRKALPNVGNAVFMNGAQIAGILESSPHNLFVCGPDMHTEVTKEEMLTVVKIAQEAMAVQQKAVSHNEALETAIANLHTDDTASAREAVAAAFGGGFCRIPVAADVDKGAKCVVMRSGNPQDPKSVKEIPLLTDEDRLLCFTSEDAVHQWQDVPRNAVSLPGEMIIDMVAQTGVAGIVVNRGSASEQALRVEKKRIVVV